MINSAVVCDEPLSTLNSLSDIKKNVHLPSQLPPPPSFSVQVSASPPLPEGHETGAYLGVLSADSFLLADSLGFRRRRRWRRWRRRKRR